MILFAIPAIAAGVYFLLVWLAALRWQRPRKQTLVAPMEPVSILKPVRHREPGFYEGIRSHALLDYPEFELLFGVSDPGDPAIQDIHQLMKEFPDRKIRLVHSTRSRPNGKVAVLEDLAAEARYPLLVINDSDIRVAPDYLGKVIAPLADPKIGIVTSLYRARAGSWPACWEALGIATEFMPSVMAARILGVSEFVLGSTMALRAAQLTEIGGFGVLGDFLADDYQLGRHISDRRYLVAFADTVVETNLGAGSWREVWRHQLRWARTIRVSNLWGYCGSIVTHATLWSLVALAAGNWRTAMAVLLMRLVAGAEAGFGVLGDANVLRRLYLIPLRDLWGFAVWLCGLFGSTVEWRGQRLKLLHDGRVVRIP